MRLAQLLNFCRQIEIRQNQNIWYPCVRNAHPLETVSAWRQKHKKKMDLIWIWFGFDLDFKNYLMDLDFNDFFNDLIWKFWFWTWFDLELIWRDSFFTDLILSLNKYQIQYTVNHYGLKNWTKMIEMCHFCSIFLICSLRFSYYFC